MFEQQLKKMLLNDFSIDYKNVLHIGPINQGAKTYWQVFATGWNIKEECKIFAFIRIDNAIEHFLKLRKQYDQGK